MRVIVTGSIAYDYIMSFPGEFSEHILQDKMDILSVSFLVDSLRRERGGCAANIAYNLALLGERPTVMATVGPDFGADRARLERAGVDTSLIHTVEEELTSSFFVSTDRKNCQIASFYVGAMGAAGRLSFHDRRPDGLELAIIAPNAPDAMDKYVRECQALGVPYIYDPSQQIVRLTGEALVAGITGSRLLVANEYEFELIKEKTGLDVADMLDLTAGLIITRGEHGSIIRAAGTVHTIPAVLTDRAVDPTGVGDAYRAGVIFGLLHGLDWPVTGRVGSLAATFALESLGTQEHAYSPEAFLARYVASFGERPAALAEALFGAATAVSPAGAPSPTV
jgi:adenosine kinase